IDQVTYDEAMPWPPEADGSGASLQLIDPFQDNNRVANWAVVSTGISRSTPGTTNSVRATRSPFPSLWLNEVLPQNFFSGTNGISDRFNERDPWIELYNGGTNTINLTGYYLANNYTNQTQWPFPANSVIPAGGFLLVWFDGEPAQSI